MYIDFEGRHLDHEPIGGTIRKWDGLLLSVGFHVVFVLVILFVPVPEFLQQVIAEEPPPAEAEAERERPRFVFVQPKLDMEAPKPPPRAEISDIDRQARTPEVVPKPQNPMPYARGDSTNRVEASPDERARGRGPEPEPKEAAAEVVERPAETLPPQQAQLTLPQQKPAQPSGGSLGEALKNLQKYVEKESFNNQQGNTQDLGPLQFDTKGVEFGPWIRRFVSQVRRNWFIPYAAMTMRGRVVLTFNVHKSGALTDVTILHPSPIDSFNTAARNALMASNPTEPLPPEYPADKAFFTVTFYYNESPGGQ